MLEDVPIVNKICYLSYGVVSVKQGEERSWELCEPMVLNKTHIEKTKGTCMGTKIVLFIE